MKVSWDIVPLFILAVVFFSILVIYYNTLPEEIFSMIYVFPITAASLMSFSLARKYKKISNFCVGHIFLGISMMAYVLAEILWVVWFGFDEGPYPSIIDIFYLIYAIFAILHPIAILKFFEIRPKRVHYVMFGGIVVTAVSAYCYFSYGVEDLSSFYMGFVFVTLSSILLGSTMLTILSTRGRQIFRVWIIIGISFLINCLTDLHYYTMENFKDWDIGYLGNITWFVSQILLVYALIEHRNKYRVLQN